MLESRNIAASVRKDVGVKNHNRKNNTLWPRGGKQGRGGVKKTNLACAEVVGTLSVLQQESSGGIALFGSE